MAASNYLRIFLVPEAPGFILIADHGDCIEPALDVVRRLDAVRDVEVDQSMATDYVPPQKEPPGPGEEPSHALFKYVVRVEAHANLNGLARTLAADIERDLAGRNVACRVILEG